MPVKRWNTIKIASWGTGFGAVYGFATANASDWAYLGGSIFGGALGGAALFALVSGLRNLILRAK